MRKFRFLLFFCFLWLVFPSLSHASGGPNLYLNGVLLSPSSKIEMIKGTTMIPIRVVVEELGFKVDWEKKTRTVTIHNDKKSISLVIDKKTATVNDKKVTLDVPPTLRGDTTLIPLRFVGQQMGLVVNWDNKSKSVHLFTSDDGSDVTEPETPTTSPGKGNSGSGSIGKGNGSSNNSSNSGNTGTGTDGTTNKPADPSPGVVLPEASQVQTIVFSDNRVVIGVDKSVKPTQQVLSNPDRIVIDLPNTKFSDLFYNGNTFAPNGQSEILVSDHAYVDKIRFSQFSDNPSTIRIVVDLKQKHEFQLSTTTDPNTVVIDLNDGIAPTDPSTIPPKSGKYVVIIDPGHGDHDSGAVSVNKRYEKNFNLALGLKVFELFQNDPDIDLVITRSDDTFLELSERVAIAKQYNADLFVSIHANSVNKPTISGTETYYSRDESLPLAEVMHKNMVAAAKLPDRSVRKKSLHVTRETTMPAVLLEVGYLTNQNDEQTLFTEEFQYNVAQGIRNGIREYLGLQP